MTSSSQRPDGKPHFYGRRSSHKLRPGRRRLVEDLLPEITVDVPPGGAKIDPFALFAADTRSLRLEIGFGAGEHLSGTAALYPKTGFIGCEPFINGVAALLADIDEGALENIRVFADDARLLLNALPDDSVSHIDVLFPDPWPKTRHHRRRIVQTEFLDTLARIAKDDAVFFFASDHMGYVDWTLDVAQRHADWAWTAQRPGDWRDPPEDWVQTRYERKARRKGDLPAYLTFRRRPRSAG